MATRGLPSWPWQRMTADALPEAERLLLDAARCWGAEVVAGRAPTPALRVLLASVTRRNRGPAAPVPDAAAALDALLRLGGHRLNCPLCPHLHEQEASLLLACGLAQQGARGPALAIFLGWLPLAAACLAVPLAENLGAALRQQGLMLKKSLRLAPDR